MKRSPLKRTTSLKRSTRRRNPRQVRYLPAERRAKAAFQNAAGAQLACMNPRCPKPCAPWHPHHVIYKRHLLDMGHDPYPPADAMRLCIDCHANYHACSLRIPADVLPPAAVAFAVELLGRERAAAYLARYYPS